MANKTILELQLIDALADDSNFAVDDGIQTYRATGAQLKALILAANSITTGMIQDEAVTLPKLADGISESFLPSGAMIAYGGASAPTGFLLCDGSAVSRTTYSALFAAISTAYGVGDGSTTFNLPDTRNVFLRGANASTRSIGGITHPAVTVGTTTGDQMQGHYHRYVRSSSMTLTNSDTGQLAPATSNLGGTGGGIEGPTTDGTNGTPRTGSTTFPVNLGVNYIIKT